MRGSKNPLPRVCAKCGNPVDPDGECCFAQVLQKKPSVKTVNRVERLGGPYNTIVYRTRQLKQKKVLCNDCGIGAQKALDDYCRGGSE